MSHMMQPSHPSIAASLTAVLWIYTALQVFGNYPYLRLLKEVGILASGTGVIVLLASLLISGRLKLAGLSVYVCLLSVWMPVQLAITANAVWGQPIMYGILARRGDILMLAVALLAELSRRRQLEARAVIRALLILVWSATVVFLGTNIFFDPMSFPDDKMFAVGGNVAAPSFVFHSHIIVFGLFYYWATARSKRDLASTLLVLFFILVMLSLGVGRAKLFAIALGILAVEYQIGKLSGLTVFMAFTLLLSLTFFLFASIALPDQLLAIVQPFQNALNVFLFAAETGESSADARIFQAELAWPIINENWLFGAGFLSTQWEGGFEGQLGYFFPTDIGMVGALFVFGLLGLALWLGLPYFAWKYARCASCRNGTFRIPYIAGVGWIVYSFALSTTTGFIFFQPAPILFFIYLIGEIRRRTLTSG